MRVRFRARGTALVTNFERLEARIKSFVGWKYKHVGPGKEDFGFVSTDEAEEVEFCGEYLQACKAGDLWPADKATADICGVPFDPTFGAPKVDKPKSDKSA